MRQADTAYDLIQRFGWVQGRGGTIDEGFCLWGALWWCYADPQWSRICTRVRQRLQSDLVTWNDHPQRTKQEVLEVLWWEGV